MMKPMEGKSKNQVEVANLEPGSRLVGDANNTHTQAAEGSFSGVNPPPDPQVRQKPFRRKFTASYKLRILEEADGLKEPGQVGALLRREGLYSSHLVLWRKQRRQGIIRGLTADKRGRKAVARSPLIEEVERLRQENEILKSRLGQAETIIEVQKKVSQLLGWTVSTPPNC